MLTGLKRWISNQSRQADNWNSRGSGFVIERILKFTVCITKFRPLHGSSFIPTPKFIANNINVCNGDEKCFLRSVLACLHPAPHNPDCISHYSQYEHTLNTDGLRFPLPTKDIPRFEAQNPTVSINVLSLGEKDFCIEYCSHERQRPHQVNLLLLDNDDRQLLRCSSCYLLYGHSFWIVLHVDLSRRCVM